jgi:methionyl aminopeptidase
LEKLNKSMTKIQLKTPDEIKIMEEGGKKLAEVKEALRQRTKAGVNAKEIDDLAEELTIKLGGKPSFKMVPGYSWTTCININEGLVHGIPKKELVFKDKDLVSIDVGMYYKGFHTDTSLSFLVGEDKLKSHFLEVGRQALETSIKAVKIGRRIYDISLAMEQCLRKAGYSPVRALVGHGVGRELHEEPQIPCFTGGQDRLASPEIVEGLVIAIEVMYTEGSGNVVLEDDGWTILTSDGKISGLFEESVAVTNKGIKVLTR